MSTDTDGRQCPQDRIDRALALISAGQGDGAALVRALLDDYPLDARLHFLLGSLLAGEQDIAGARAAMTRAVELAPHYPIARFQLGLLLLTSGEAAAAEQIWAPLESLNVANALRLFVVGLRHMIRDEFERAIESLNAGIAANQENPALNRDMQMVIDEIRTRTGIGEAAEPRSAVDMLLQHSALKRRPH